MHPSLCRERNSAWGRMDQCRDLSARASAPRRTTSRYSTFPGGRPVTEMGVPRTRLRFFVPGAIPGHRYSRVLCPGRIILPACGTTRWHLRNDLMLDDVDL